MPIDYFIKIDGFNNPVNDKGIEAYSFYTEMSGRPGSQHYVNGNLANEYGVLSTHVFGKKLGSPNDPKKLMSSFNELKNFLKDAKQGSLKVTITGKWQKPNSDKMEDLLTITLEKCSIENVSATETDDTSQVPIEGTFDVRFGKIDTKLEIIKPDYTSGGQSAGSFDFVENKSA